MPCNFLGSTPCSFFLNMAVSKKLQAQQGGAQQK